jgi:hypothetical protein
MAEKKESTTPETLEACQAENAELREQLDKATSVNATLESKVATMEFTLKSIGRNAYPPEVIKLAKEKIDAGLPADDAWDVAMRQYQRDSAASKPKAKASAG